MFLRRDSDIGEVCRWISENHTSVFSKWTNYGTYHGVLLKTRRVSSKCAALENAWHCRTGRFLTVDSTRAPSWFSKTIMYSDVFFSIYSTRFKENIQVRFDINLMLFDFEKVHLKKNRVILSEVQLYVSLLVRVMAAESKPAKQMFFRVDAGVFFNMQFSLRRLAR